MKDAKEVRQAETWRMGEPPGQDDSCRSLGPSLSVQ